jgi:riboflavin kinase/FMN adenylyltransferase
VFDGVHRAHQEICRRVVELGRELNAEPTAVTFFPHPAAVLAPARAPRLLYGLGDRLRFLQQIGLELVVVQPFDAEFARTEAEAFVRGELGGRLAAVQVVVGHSVSFGRGRAGDARLLQRLGADLGFGVEVVGPVEVAGTVVSSTAIREAIAAGEMDRAAALLGREHFVRGRVVHGQRRGSKLGFPTANLRVRTGLLPRNGVYAVRVSRGKHTHGGVANLGINPTFGGEERSLEPHLFDFEGDLYGEYLKVAFVRRLRDERRFASADDLISQIRRDVEEARRTLARG